MMSASKRHGKLSLKYSLDVTRMQEMNSRNQNFLGRGGGHDPPPRGTRLWRAVCLWHANLPLLQSLDPALNEASISVHSSRSSVAVATRLHYIYIFPVTSPLGPVDVL